MRLVITDAGNRMLSKLKEDEEFRDIISPTEFRLLRFIKKYGNTLDVISLAKKAFTDSSTRWDFDSASELENLEFFSDIVSNLLKLRLVRYRD